MNSFFFLLSIRLINNSSSLTLGCAGIWYYWLIKKQMKQYENSNRISTTMISLVSRYILLLQGKYSVSNPLQLPVAVVVRTLHHLGRET